MSRIKNELATRCELAMMGKVVKCDSDEALAMTEYILTTLKASFEDLETDAEVIVNRLNNQSKHLVVNTVDEFIMISYLIDDGEIPYPDDLATPDGILCYVYNVTAPMFSEFGYCFFEKREDQFYHRIG